MATRFYLPSSGTPPLTTLPAFDAGWEDTSIAARLPMSTTKSSTAMTTVSFLDNNATSRDVLFYQYQSVPIAAQTISAQTLKFQIRGQLTSAGDAMFTSIGARVVSGDGNTVRGTLLAVTRDDALLTSTLTNRAFTATTTEVTASEGDRIVIEIGVGGDPAGSSDHDANLRVGDAAASDLAEDDSSTTDNNPWVEFPNTIANPQESTTADSGSYALTGNTVSLQRTYILTATAGTYESTGNTVSLAKGSQLVAESGTYGLTGNSISTERTYILTATGGIYELTGNTIALSKGGGGEPSAGRQTASGRIKHSGRGQIGVMRRSAGNRITV